MTSTTAERSRRYRERKRRGVVGVVQVPIYALDIEALVRHSRLAPEDEKDRDKIAEAVEYLVEDFAQGKLVLARHA